MTQLPALSMVVLEDVDALFTNHREADQNNSSLLLGPLGRCFQAVSDGFEALPVDFEVVSLGFQVLQRLPELPRWPRGAGRRGDLHDHEPPREAGPGGDAAREDRPEG